MYFQCYQRVMTKKSVQSVMNERVLLSQFNSPFVVNMHFAFQDRDTLYLVLDLMEGAFGGSEIDIAYAATKTPDGNYVIAGDTRSNDGDVTGFNGNADAWIIKINDQGDLLWQKTLGGTNFDTARAITATINGLAITGSSRSDDIDVTTNAGQNDIWIALLDADGNLQDQRSIGGDGIDFGFGIASNSQGNIIIAGETQSATGEITSSNGSLDAVLIKIN